MVEEQEGEEVATDINITAEDIMAILKPEGVPVVAQTNTNTTYDTDDFIISPPAAKLVSEAGSGELLDYTVRPEFNYIATNFNDSYVGVNEKMMPTPYSEIYQKSEVLEAAYTDPIFENGAEIYFNILEGGNVDAGSEESLTNPRLIFLGKAQGATIRTRGVANQSNFENIIITNASQNVSAKSVGKYFPQYVVVGLAGSSIAPKSIHMETSYPGNLLNKCLNTDGALAHLMVDFVVNRHNVRSEIGQFGYQEISVNSINEQSTNQIIRSWKFWNISQVSTAQDVIIQDTILSNFQTDFVLDDFFECVNPINTDEYVASRQDIKDSLSEKVNQMSDYSEVELLFYKVEKHDTDGLVQTFWTTVLSTAGSSFEFIDTQVKVGKEYTYRCYGYYLHFTNSSQDTRLTEVPLFSQSFKIEQPSLPRPQVQFVNVKDSKDEIRIFLNQSANFEDMQFYGLNAGERDAFISRHEMYDITQEKNRFVYETDVGRYQIYKMNEQPLMGENNDPYANIVPNSTLFEINGRYNSTAGYFSDTLVPFKKYYYVFRAVNNYGYFSNPSPIYEVELTKDADETFLNTNVVGFADPNIDKYLLSKTMMRLMQVVPSPAQTAFYPEGSIQTNETAVRDNGGNHIVGFINENGTTVQVGYVNFEGDIIYTIDQNVLYSGGLTFEEYINVNGAAPLYETQEINSLSEYGPNNEIPTLGTAQEKIWTTKDSSGNILVEGKRFKIRLVSKDSGRKIDFNLRFILNKNYNTNGPN